MVEILDSSKYLSHLVYNTLKRYQMKKYKICGKCSKKHKEWKKGTQCNNCRSLIQKECYNNKKNQYIQKAKTYYSKNKNSKLEYAKNYRQNNSDKIEKYWAENKSKIYKQRAKREKERRKQDISFKIQTNLRKRMYNALKGSTKGKNTKELFGCDINLLKKHIENLWTDGMSWENYGLTGWHIDHIKPCDAFDLSNYDQQKQCFHYTNLQPLWAIDNIRKSNKVL